MKKTLIILSSVLTGLIFLVYFTLYLWIDRDAKRNIRIAQEIFPGKAEDALIAYLSDSAISPQNRTRVAIWTLGQIKSEKAIPVLKNLYTNDPKGKTCYGKHDSVLCQYELYKALRKIEGNWLPLHSRLK